MTSPKWYDITLSKEKMAQTGRKDAMAIGALFDEMGAENWVVGNEVGADGYEHYQCKVVFKKGVEWEHLKRVFAGLGNVAPSMTHNWDYVQKEGSFVRSWEKAISKYSQITLRGWQQQAVDLLKSQSERCVDVIVDYDGNHGKTYLRKYLQSSHICEYIPKMSSEKDMMRIAMSKTGRGYCFDLPRCDDITDKKNLQMWRAIEQIKDGYLYEDRYQFAEKWIDPPKILVFTNDDPPYDALSRDRWRVYKFTKHGKEDLLYCERRGGEGTMRASALDA